MAPLETAYSLQLLDEVDLTQDAPGQIEQLRQALPRLRDELQKAREWVAGAMGPVPPQHPSHDTWDDQIWFQRAMAESGYPAKQEAVQVAADELDELERSPDPGRSVAGWVLDDAHAYLKSLGLDTHAARAASGPPSVGGVPLATLIWEARNQAHHHNDARPLGDRCVEAMRVIVANDPPLFGRTTAPGHDADLRSLLKERSWAREVLLALGWASAPDVQADLKRIVT